MADALAFNFEAPLVDPHSTPYQKSSATSKDAAIRAQHFAATQERTVLVWIREQGDRGATQREVSEALQIGRPSICARVRALEQAHAILKTGERRGHCVVYRAI